MENNNSREERNEESEVRRVQIFLSLKLEEGLNGARERNLKISLDT